MIGRSDCASESPTFDESLLLPGCGLPGVDSLGNPGQATSGVAGLAKPVTDILDDVTDTVGGILG